jgi:catechol 2,3-dioxygenase-like lactoylglutathione lyase family enzyme
MQNAVRPHHVGLTVSDLARAQAWYAQALGFELQLAFTLPNGARGAMLRSPDGARMELFEVDAPQAGRSWLEPHTAMDTSGFGHVAFEVDDLEAAFAAAVAAGGTDVWTPRPSPEPGRRMAFIHDLDGNLLELIGPVQ